MADVTSDLDTKGRLALDAALGLATSMGDHRCGTEHLLYGLCTTARGEMAEIVDLFVLDAARLERAIAALRADRVPGGAHDDRLRLTPRARAALRTPRHDGSGPTGEFEILVGVLADESSGASQVLRELGVRAEEVRRLAAYGTRHLSREEAALLLELLDRRRPDTHQPWWGPAPGQVPVPLAGFEPVELARSSSAVAWLEAVGVDAEGFGVSVRVRSLRPWVLPPTVEPPEILVPGVPGAAAAHSHGPELLRLSLGFADGARVDNTVAVQRFSPRRPDAAVLVPLRHRCESVTYNDRRRGEERSVSTQWWVWPLPAPGPVEVRIEWPAEVLAGAVVLDGRPMLRTAVGLAARAGYRDVSPGEAARPPRTASGP